MKISEPCAARRGAVGELARQAQLAHRGLARDLLFLAAAQALVGALDHPVEQLGGVARMPGEPVVERVLTAASTMRCASPVDEAILGLALEFRLADEDGEHRARACHHVVARDGRRALALAHALGMVLQAAQERAAEARLVRAAIAGRDRVAVGGEEAVAVGGPGDRPFDRAVRAGPAGAAGENVGMHQRLAVERAREIILQAAREVEGLLRLTPSIPASSAGSHRQRISTPPNR